MTDEREASVAEEDKPRAFNNQPLCKRAAIVVAGPLANLVLAVLFFAAINWWGMQQPVAVLGTPAASSLAAKAGLQAGDTVISAKVGVQDEEQSIASFDELRWVITHAAFNHQNLQLQIQASNEGGRNTWHTLLLSELEANDLTPEVYQQIGVVMPAMAANLRKINTGGAAEAAGLKAGDVVLAINGKPVRDASELFTLIAQTGEITDSAARTQTWQVERDGQAINLQVTPGLTERDGKTVGFINAQIGQEAYKTTLVRYGLWDGLWRGIVRTWEMSVMTVQMFGRMIIGEASLKNISGPISIAQYAGQSASLGMEQFLYFLAIVSLSLGVLNLLPLPVLDGGHLMYYLWEAVTGKPVTDAWMERLQHFGIMALLLLMSLALFNDISRLLG